MASLLTADVAQLLTNASMRPIVRKKAALALLRLLRKSSDNAEDILPAEVRSVVVEYANVLMLAMCRYKAGGHPVLLPNDSLALHYSLFCSCYCIVFSSVVPACAPGIVMLPGLPGNHDRVAMRLHVLS